MDLSVLVLKPKNILGKSPPIVNKI